MAVVRRSRLAGDAGIVIVARAGNVVGSFVTAGVAGRVLSPREFGAYFAVFSAVVIVATAARFGTSRAVVPLIAKAEEHWRWGLSRSLRTASIGVAVVGTALLVVPGGSSMGVGGIDGRGTQAAIVVWMAAEAVRLVVAEALRGRGDTKGASVLGDPCRTVLTALGVVLLVLVRTDAGLEQFVEVSALASVATGLLAAARHLAVGEPNGARNPIGAGASLGLTSLAAFAVADVSAIAMNQGDMWFAERYLPAVDAGLYAAASRLVLVVNLAQIVLNNTLAAPIAREPAGSRQRLSKVIQPSVLISTAAAGVLVLVFALWGEAVLGLAVGDAFRSAAPILTVRSVGVLASVAAGPAALTLMLTGHERTAGAVAVVGAAATVGLYYAAAVLGDAWWLAAASSLGLVGQNLVFTVIVARVVGVRTWASPSAALRSARSRSR